MARYEYDISKHPAEEFRELAYFCTKEGECQLSELPMDQVRVLVEILNRRGDEGWELVQLAFGSDGLVAFWRRTF